MRTSGSIYVALPWAGSRMSEYQYYEFLAIDRPLDRSAQEQLRLISSRAEITASSFTNHYEWGDFKGDPQEFMERWFDLHLYLANWGTRCLMIRVPKRCLNPRDLDPFLGTVEDAAEVSIAGDNVIVSIAFNELDLDDDAEGGANRLGSLVPLRAEMMSGDLRLFYLVWLTGVQYELAEDDEIEPLPGIGPLTAAQESFVDFFAIDSDLVQAAAELEAPADSEDDLCAILSGLPEKEKIELLLRVAKGDAGVTAELKKRARKAPATSEPRRTAGALRKRAQEIADARERAAAERREAKRRQEAEAAEKVRQERMAALKRRGDDVWREVEAEIAHRNPAGYSKVEILLSDLKVLAAEEGRESAFKHHIADIRARHGGKKTFIARLDRLRL
jgi:hypothetical protein